MMLGGSLTLSWKENEGLAAKGFLVVSAIVVGNRVLGNGKIMLIARDVNMGIARVAVIVEVVIVVVMIEKNN